MSGGIDQIFTEPPHEIRGATKVDQAWIDENVEAGKSCCGWQIKPRPQSLDARPLDAPAVALPPVAVKPKKKPLWKRLLRPTS